MNGLLKYFGIITMNYDMFTYKFNKISKILKSIYNIQLTSI